MAYAPIWVPAAIALTGIGHQERVGQDAAKKQKVALGKQEQAQKNAQAKASSDAASADRENKKAARAQPDLGSILTDAQMLSAQGNTSLTGSGGVDPQRLKLSRATLLGG